MGRPKKTKKQISLIIPYLISQGYTKKKTNSSSDDKPRFEYIRGDDKLKTSEGYIVNSTFYFNKS